MATKKKPLRIIGLKRSPSKGDRELYSFGVCCVAGLLFNGFVYSRGSGAIFPPSTTIRGKKFPLVKGFGVHWKRLKEMVEEEINGATEDTPIIE